MFSVALLGVEGNPELSAFLEERRLPVALTGYLALLGVHSLSQFIALGGEAWEAVATSSGRALSTHASRHHPHALSVAGKRRRHAKLPRLLIYQNKGLLRLGASRRVIGPRLHVPGNSSELLGYATLFEDAVLLAPIRDALRGYPNLASAECRTATEQDSLVDIFISFLQPAVTPLLPRFMTRQERKRWASEHSDAAAQCSESAIKDRERLHGQNFDRVQCMNMLRARHEECAQVHNMSALTRLNGNTSRRHFVFYLDGAARGEVLQMVGVEATGSMLCEPIPPLTLRLGYDHVIQDQRNFAPDPGTRLQIPVLTNIRWSAQLDELGLIPPWKSAAAFPERRTVLMSFIGSTNVNVKALIGKMCRRFASVSVSVSLS